MSSSGDELLFIVRWFIPGLTFRRYNEVGNMNKLILKKCQEKRGPGYSLRIQDKKASIQDLLDEMDEFIARGGLPRLWPEDTDTCRSCHFCCHEPLPLTSIDMFRICRATGSDFIRAFRYLRLEVQGSAVDITLKRRGGNCVFLNKDGTCKIYYNRPFSCHVYICCHVQKNVEELYSQVVNQGMDELVRLAIKEFKRRGMVLPAAGGTGKTVNPADWQPNCFTGKPDYGKILLEEVLTSDLMKVLLV